MTQDIETSEILKQKLLTTKMSEHCVVLVVLHRFLTI